MPVSPELATAITELEREVSQKDLSLFNLTKPYSLNERMLKLEFEISQTFSQVSSQAKIKLKKPKDIERLYANIDKLTRLYHLPDKILALQKKVMNLRALLEQTTNNTQFSSTASPL